MSSTPPGAQPTTKLCPFCAEQIAFNAIKCKHCGSAILGSNQPDQVPSVITAPLLISAISNIVVALLWINASFIWDQPLVLLIPVAMIVLCVFEFALYAKADTLKPADLAKQVNRITLFEVVVGLLNLVSFICGIVLSVNLRRVMPRAILAQDSQGLSAADIEGLNDQWWLVLRRVLRVVALAFLSLFIALWVVGLIQGFLDEGPQVIV
ncbi:MAG TPA: hypothetical protein VMV69_16495 [Pirellulales bacterium]|nr:hypothetical protein [Pirellulales bacterium]